MSVLSAAMASPWLASTLPTTTLIRSINTAHLSSLQNVIMLVTSVAPTVTNEATLHYLSKSFRGAQASMTIILGEQYLATATATQDFPQVTEAIFNATLNLIALKEEGNLYSMKPNLAANLIFTILFGLALVLHIIIAIYGKTIYFGICFFAGTGLEFAGYLARTMAVNDRDNLNYFLCQIICLTIAPAFLMAGIYYLLALLIVLNGRLFSILRPLWFSYIFVCCDVLSLVIQAVGGAITATSLLNYESTTGGTNIMVAGIAFQVASMSLFLGFYCDFVHRTFFKASSEVQFTVKNFLKMLFNTAEGKQMKEKCELAYDVTYKEVRQRRLFNWAPLIILISVMFIYVRCIYRVIELAEGWSGNLIVHEAYIMILDALMCFLTSAMYVFFHPAFIFGRGLKFSWRADNKKQNGTEKIGDRESEEGDVSKERRDEGDDGVSIPFESSKC